MAYARITLETDDETRFEIEISEKYSNMRKAVEQCAEAAHEWIRQTFPDPVPAEKVRGHSDTCWLDTDHKGDCPSLDQHKKSLSYAHGSPVRNDVPPWNELVGCDECRVDAMCERHATHVRETKISMEQWSGVPDTALPGLYVAGPGLPLVPQPGEPCRFCGCSVEGGNGMCHHETAPGLTDWRGVVLQRNEQAKLDQEEIDTWKKVAMDSDKRANQAEKNMYRLRQRIAEFLV